MSRPPADGPSFDQRIAALDRGLAASEPPHRVTAPSAPFPDPPGAANRRRRPLLDLFPPAPSEGERTEPVAHDPSQVIRRHVVADFEVSVSESPSAYESFYGLVEPPFGLAPDLKFLYHTTPHDRVMQDLHDAIVRGDRVMVVTGLLGLGKTMLCRALGSGPGRQTAVALMAEPVVSIEQVLQKALIDFGVIAAGEVATSRLASASRIDLVLAVGDFAASLAPLGAAAVLVVDDAHNAPADVLEALCDLAVTGAEQRQLRLVLVGEPALLSMLRGGALGSHRRWIGVKAQLEPLSAEELTGYVVHRLAVAGPNARVEFSGRAMAALHRLTLGVPRLANLVCDRALRLGCERAASLIDADLVVAAAEEAGVAPAGSGRTVQLAVRVLVLLFLALTGAAAALWLFRDAVSRILTAYR
jgi:type II secretory pathway predicted ATPase ExeA